MGRAGKALKWVNEVRDPGGETILEIRTALQQINPAASEEFIRLYQDMPPNCEQ
jgi:hypothetical protein